GGPRDPQAGNSHGQRDVLRTSGTLQLDAAPPPLAAAVAAAVASADGTAPVPSAPAPSAATPPVPLISPALSLLPLVGRNSSLVATGPAGAVIAWSIGDGTIVVSGTATIGDDGTATIPLDLSGRRDGP